MKSYSFTLLACCLFFSGILNAQSTQDSILFNNYVSPADNDLANYYTGAVGMNQVTTGGISGGGITVPDSISWGNDAARYCHKYVASIGDTLITSMAFKYNANLIKSSAFQRAASLWLKPKSNSNHYIIATVEANGRMGLLTWGWNNNYATILTMTTGHWYELRLRVRMTGGGVMNDELIIAGEVFDLGTSGHSNPTSIGSDMGTINDSFFVADTAVFVDYDGAQFGGSALLDNFTFKGPRKANIIPPVLGACPSDTIVLGGGAGCVKAVSWIPPAATDDACTPPLVTANYSPGDTFQLGTSTVLYTATDYAGNTDTCSFSVTVNCIPNDVDYQELSTQIKCLANPFSKALKLDLEGELSMRPLTISILDLQGKTVFTSHRKFPKRTQLDLEYLEDGIYFLYIVRDGFYWSRKLLKQEN